MRISYFVLLPVFALSALSARADILFIDFNCSASEIAAAQKAAEARGEELVVLPSRTPEQEKFFSERHDLDLSGEKLVNELSLLQIEARSEPAQAAGLASRIATLSRRMTEIVSQNAALKNKSAALGEPRFSTQELDSVLKKYAASRKSFETVIISGHHGGDAFFGLFGTLFNQTDITKSFAKYPALLNAVHAYYGWGCYTNTPSQSLEWQSTFPGLELTGGFDASAPGDESQPSSGFLTALLKKEAQLVRISEHKADQENIKQVSGFIRSVDDFNLTNASVCTCGECVGRNIGEVPLKLSKGCDMQALNMLRERASLTNSPEIPCDTQHSDLRAFYDLARQKQYCADGTGALQSNFRVYTSRADWALQRIYEKQILKNFLLYYADELREVAAIQNRCSLTPLPDLNRPLACDPPDHDSANELQQNDLDQVMETVQVPRSDCIGARDQAILSLFSCHWSELTGYQISLPASWVDEVSDRSQLQKPVDNCASAGTGGQGTIVGR